VDRYRHRRVCLRSGSGPRRDNHSTWRSHGPADSRSAADCGCQLKEQVLRLTVKSQGADGSFRRGEWEHEIKGDVPDLHKVQGTALEPLLIKKFEHKLVPVFETRVRRTIGPVRRNGSRIEVALDEGEIRAGRRSAPISEVELELKDGDAGEVFELARELGKHPSVKLALNSKSKRALLDNKGIEAAPAEKIKLRHGMMLGMLSISAGTPRISAKRLNPWRSIMLP
jgi:inorganic triphosphatase YgiF